MQLIESQYLTFELLVLLLQSHRQIQLSRLSSLVPQLIHYSSRIRIKKWRIDHYVSRLQDKKRCLLRHRYFTIGLYGYLWGYDMEVWDSLAIDLMKLKTHKRLNFQRGIRDLYLVQQAFQGCCHP